MQSERSPTPGTDAAGATITADLIGTRLGPEAACAAVTAPAAKPAGTAIARVLATRAGRRAIGP